MLEAVTLASSLVDLWRIGKNLARFAIVVAFILVISAIFILGFAEIFGLNPRIASQIAAGLGGMGRLIGLILFGYRKALAQDEQASKIEQVERKVAENPTELQVAWELAKVRLESYLERNLQQVRSIYILILLVMFIGFTLIGYGIFKVYDNPKNFSASVIAAISGLLINFIGASFIVIYRSTMEQAKDYVNVLERINAVGMAVQVISAINSTDESLKNSSMAEVAKDLLRMYSVRPTESKDKVVSG